MNQEEFEASYLAPVTAENMPYYEETSRWRGRLFGGALIAATGAALLFEQSPGNESVRATAAFNVLEDTEDPLAAGLMVAGLTVAIEGVTGGLIGAGLNREKDRLQPKLERFRKNIIKEPEPIEESETLVDPNKRQRGKVARALGRAVTKVTTTTTKVATKLTDTGITCTVGPGMVVLRRHFQEDERSMRKDMKTLTGYTAVGAGVSGGIGYLATGGVEHADKVGLETPAEYFVDYATDWKFWTALLAGGYGIKYTKLGISKVIDRFKKDKEETPALIPAE